MPTTAPRPWYVYLLACRRGTYVGITNDLLRRYRAHCAGRGARYTRANPPQAILGARAFADRAEASRMEYWLKRQTPEDKRRWIAAAPLPPEVVAALAATDATS
ncbi:GIY-YIG nuclease family protein [Halomonas dongshanensis]|uniref:GIY-YIG nuclease family protein n=1 Tax=Halomonas dongshanensis TaxID=2890835 RepID=A0ABT2EFP2_9GAMM|nr:GIY-YIG nuclease family protein [Halomonas dongshanensis]MCS2610401.1 GIY-YIG nuclease family protein [Halomonas dongshanensis]